MRRFGDLLLASLPFVVMIGIWQALSVYGGFPEKLVPSISQIFQTFFRLLNEGILLSSAASTLNRLLLGFLISGVVGVFVGILMGRYRVIEETLLPLISFIYPIPGIAYAPLFVLWFGIGNFSTILVVIYASIFTMIFNTWTGVRAINQIWYKSAVVMGANSRQMLFKVMLPGTMPYIISGLRISFGRAWIAVIGGELLASPDWGLGKIIFDAREFLDTESMLSALVFIGLIGIGIEKLFLKRLEKVTIERWGMSQSQSS